MFSFKSLKSLLMLSAIPAALMSFASPARAMQDVGTCFKKGFGPDCVMSAENENTKGGKKVRQLADSVHTTDAEYQAQGPESRLADIVWKAALKKGVLTPAKIATGKINGYHFSFTGTFEGKTYDHVEISAIRMAKDALPRLIKLNVPKQTKINCDTLDLNLGTPPAVTASPPPQDTPPAYVPPAETPPAVVAVPPEAPKPSRLSVLAGGGYTIVGRGNGNTAENKIAQGNDMVYAEGQVKITDKLRGTVRVSGGTPGGPGKFTRGETNAGLRYDGKVLSVSGSAGYMLPGQGVTPQGNAAGIGAGAGNNGLEPSLGGRLVVEARPTGPLSLAAGATVAKNFTEFGGNIGLHKDRLGLSLDAVHTDQRNVQNDPNITRSTTGVEARGVYDFGKAGGAYAGVRGAYLDTTTRVNVGGASISDHTTGYEIGPVLGTTVDKGRIRLEAQTGYQDQRSDLTSSRFSTSVNGVKGVFGRLTARIALGGPKTTVDTGTPGNLLPVENRVQVGGGVEAYNDAMAACDAKTTGAEDCRINVETNRAQILNISDARPTTTSTAADSLAAANETSVYDACTTVRANGAAVTDQGCVQSETKYRANLASKAMQACIDAAKSSGAWERVGPSAANASCQRNPQVAMRP